MKSKIKKVLISKSQMDVLLNDIYFGKQWGYFDRTAGANLLTAWDLTAGLVPKDIVVAAVSSVVPTELNENDILLTPDTVNSLRATSILKVDRIVTVKLEDVIAKLGKLYIAQRKLFIEKFNNLVK